ncbi:unnamed protein product [Umbelopsis vinacea]
MPFLSTADGAWPPYLTFPHLRRRIRQLLFWHKLRQQEPKELDHEQLKEKGYILREGLLWEDYDPGRVRGTRVESYLRSSTKPHYIKGTNIKSCVYPHVYPHIMMFPHLVSHENDQFSPLRQAAATIGPVTEMYIETFEAGIILTVIGILEKDFTRLWAQGNSIDEGEYVDTAFMIYANIRKRDELGNKLLLKTNEASNLINIYKYMRMLCAATIRGPPNRYPSIIYQFWCDHTFRGVTTPELNNGSYVSRLYALLPVSESLQLIYLREEMLNINAIIAHYSTELDEIGLFARRYIYDQSRSIYPMDFPGAEIYGITYGGRIYSYTKVSVVCLDEAVVVTRQLIEPYDGEILDHLARTDDGVILQKHMGYTMLIYSLAVVLILGAFPLAIMLPDTWNGRTYDPTSFIQMCFVIFAGLTYWISATFMNGADLKDAYRGMVRRTRFKDLFKRTVKDRQVIRELVKAMWWEPRIVKNAMTKRSAFFIPECDGTLPLGAKATLPVLNTLGFHEYDSEEAEFSTTFVTCIDMEKQKIRCYDCLSDWTGSAYIGAKKVLDLKVLKGKRQ